MQSPSAGRYSWKTIYRYYFWFRLSCYFHISKYGSFLNEICMLFILLFGFKRALWPLDLNIISILLYLIKVIHCTWDSIFMYWEVEITLFYKNKACAETNNYIHDICKVDVCHLPKMNFKTFSRKLLQGAVLIVLLCIILLVWQDNSPSIEIQMALLYRRVYLIIEMIDNGPNIDMDQK